MDVNVFVFNLLDREKQLNAPLTGINDGRGLCAASSINCSTYLSYNPFVTQLRQAPRRRPST
ncbi:MAG TPA: hypothetical protein VI653_01465 [Steroidobacteraceae bacterium]